MICEQMVHWREKSKKIDPLSNLKSMPMGVYFLQLFVKTPIGQGSFHPGQFGLPFMESESFHPRQYGPPVDRALINLGNLDPHWRGVFSS